MSKLIPPLVSTTPPPISIADGDDIEDDEFGDFTAADDTTYGCDSYSIPNTPEDSPKKVHQLMTNDLIPTRTREHENANEKGKEIKDQQEKDYQDKRKMEENAQSINSNGITLPNVPKVINNADNADAVLSNDLTNGYLTYEECNREIPENFDEIERPPELLFDDVDMEKEEISETPSNFSISFDDNVIDDDEDESEANDVNIDLPNHNMSEVPEEVNEQNNLKIDDLEAPKAVFEDFDDEIVDDFAADCNEENTQNLVRTSHNNTVTVNSTEFKAFSSLSFEEIEETNENEISPNMDQQITRTNEVLDENQGESKVKDVPIGNPPEIIDDFDDFQFTVGSTTEKANSNEQEHPGAMQDNEDYEKEAFDDFADFSSAAFEVPGVSHRPNESDLENVPSQSEFIENNANKTKINEIDEIPDCDDDFGDFGDYTTIALPNTTPTNTEVPLMTPKTAYENAQCIFKVMFESAALPEDIDDYTYCDFTQTDEIFKQIKDVTDTHALSYQWAKSQVQQGLLKALNIDTRNILYAHGIVMPKFAANLGMTPLEPVKSDILMPTPAGTATTSTNPSNDTNTQHQPIQPNISGDVAIPSAQFDWSESGLANPLDSNQTSTLFDLEQLTASLSLPTTATYMNHVDSYAQSNEKMNLDHEDWDLWLQSVSKEEDAKSQPRSSQNSDDFKEFKEPLPKVSSYNASTYDTESVNSLQFPELSGDNGDPDDVPKNLEQNTDDFSDFTSFQTISNQHNSQIETPIVGWTGNMIPLRETYIDDVKTDWNVPIGDNMSGKSRSSCNSSNSGTSSAGIEKIVVDDIKDRNESVNVVDEFTDFQDFQMGASTAIEARQTSIDATNPAVDAKLSNMNAFGGNLLTPTMLEPVKLNQPQIAQQILWPDPGITDDELERFDLYAKKDGKFDTATPTIVNKSTSASLSSTNEISKLPETKLSGPGGSLMVEKSVVVPANKVILPFNEVILPPNNQVVISKDLVLPILESSPRKYTPQKPSTSHYHASGQQESEDDWSDFISSTQPTATGKSNIQLSPSKNRTGTGTASNSGTPELSLSIPQLSSIQPSKTPIPVITPRGLMQTKIPTMSPSTPTKSLQQIQQTPLHVNLPMDGYQPAIISNQFAAQMNQSTFSEFLHSSHYQTTSIPANIVGKKSHGHGYLTPTHQKLNGFHDDNDEWSDFMSSQPVHSANSSLYHISAGPAGMSTRMEMDWNRNNGLSTELPNIITNPVHFQNYPVGNTANSLSGKKPNGILNSKKQQNLNVSRLPDLDFVAPKTKVYHNNKK